MIERRIPLDHVKLAAVHAGRMRRVAPGLAPLAAMTGVPGHVRCTDRVRHRISPANSPYARLQLTHGRAPLITPLMRGDLASLVERTRLHYGLAEVRRTWGSGLRALRAEPRHTVPMGVRP